MVSTIGVGSGGLRKRGACSISRARGLKLTKISQHLLNHKVCGVGNASVFLAISLHALSASHRDMTV